MQALTSVTGVAVQLLGEQRDVAQLLLWPLQTVSVEAQTIVYSSKVAIEADPALQGKSCRRLLVNRGDALEYAAVGVHDGGPILVLNPHIVAPEAGLIVQTSLLLATTKVSSQPYLYLSLRDSHGLKQDFRMLKGDGLALFQAQGAILEKALAEGEEVDIPLAHIAGFSASVTISVAARNNVLRNVGQMMTLKGPGLVYIAPVHLGHQEKSTFSALDIVLFLILMYLLDRGCSFVLAYIKRLLNSYDS